MKKKISLNRFLLVMLVGVFSAVLLLLLGTLFYSVNSYNRTIRNQWNNLVQHYAFVLENNLDTIASESYSIYASDQDFQDLSAAPENAVDAYTHSRRLDNRMLGVLSKNAHVNGYFVFYQNMEKVNMFQEFGVLEHGDMVLIRDFLKNMLPNRGNGKFWYYCAVKGKAVAVSVTRKNDAAVAMVYVMDLLTEDILEELPDREANAFLTKNGRYLSDRGELPEDVDLQKDRSYSGVLNGSFISGRRIGNTGIWFWLTVPLSVGDYFSTTQIILSVLTIITIILSIAAYLYIRQRLIRPMYQLVETMREISDGNMEKEIRVLDTFSELMLVGETLEHTLQEVQRQKDSLYAETIEKQKAQMQYLSMQLKPHFYLNGLKTINAYALSGNSAKIQDIVLRLSVHMRYILQIERELVSLQDEIDYVNNYVQLRRDMTDRPINLSWDIPQKLQLEWKVPTLCIQTFVENSVKYAKVGDPGAALSISIALGELSTEDGCFLDITVTDNGEGYPEKLLEELNGDPLEQTLCVGINNLKRRCRILYGDTAEYVFYNMDGAVSELILPQKRQQHP